MKYIFLPWHISHTQPKAHFQATVYLIFFINLKCSGEMGAICVSGGAAAVDLEQVAAENREFLSTRTSEKQEMVVLNDRLAVYIEKASIAYITYLHTVFVFMYLRLKINNLSHVA